MQLSRNALLACLFVASACGPGDPPDVCGQSGVIPETDEVPDGRGKALVDGAEWQEPGSWAPGPNASIDIGTLSMIVAVDETGTDTSDLIARRAFPICIPLGERSEESGNASFEGSFVTDAGHTGGVAILGEVGGQLLGRFSLDAKAPSTGETRSLTEGAFRVGRR